MTLTSPWNGHSETWDVGGVTHSIERGLDGIQVWSLGSDAWVFLSSHADYASALAALGAAS